jgi:hypothetical protein
MAWLADGEKLALELEHYIRDYIPEGWTESLENVMFVPWVSINDIKLILKDEIPCKFDKTPFKQAIWDWKEMKGMNEGTREPQCTSD